MERRSALSGGIRPPQRRRPPSEFSSPKFHPKHWRWMLSPSDKFRSIVLRYVPCLARDTATSSDGPTMSTDQNHHYLPQSYQRGWADASGRPHVYRWHHDRLLCDLKATRATGGEKGLYYVPMAPPEMRNVMEDVFWRQVDQWGADGLSVMRQATEDIEHRLNKPKLATFITSFLYRNPAKIDYFEALAREHFLTRCSPEGYAAYRRPHEPATFEGFLAGLDQPGMSEMGAAMLRSAVQNPPIRTHLLSMDWQIVTVTDGEPILTSDVPLIVFKGLADAEALLILPLSSTEFFVAFNRGPIDMKARIQRAIEDGAFVEAMNRYVVQHKIAFVYACDDSQKDFVSRHWAISSAQAAQTDGLGRRR